MHPSEIGVRRPKPRGPYQRNIFAEVNNAALSQIKSLAERWLPRTRMSGSNLMALNPTRVDKSIGSFGINVKTGAWADFATDEAWCAPIGWSSLNVSAWLAFGLSGRCFWAQAVGSPRRCAA